MYDVFLSHATYDNAGGWVTALRDFIRADFTSYGHPEPRIFFNRDEIADLDLWQREVLVALRESRVLVSCVSPSYWDREWCAREWVQFPRLAAARQVGEDTVAVVRLTDEVTDPRLADPAAALARHAEAEEDMAQRQQTDLRPWFALPPSVAIERPEVREVLARLCVRIDARIRRAQLVDDVPGNLRRFNPHFVGRDADLTRLRTTVAASRVGIVTAVGALGGVGKTELVAAYAHQFRYAYPGGTWQVACDGVASVFDALVLLSYERSLGIEVGDDVPPAMRERHRVDLTLARLRALAYAPTAPGGRSVDDSAPPRALLVFDNVSSAGFLAPGSVAALPDEAWLHVVATTRLAVPDSVELGGLTVDDAVDLIRSRQPRRSDLDGAQPAFVDAAADEEAGVLAATLDGHALAVEQAAVYLGLHPELRPQDVLDLLATYGVSAVERVNSSVPTRVFQVIERRDASLTALLDQTVAGLSPRASAALEFAALMPPAGFAWEWLKELTAEHGDERWATTRRALEGRRLVVTSDTPALARLHRLVGGRVLATSSPQRAQDLDDWLARALRTRTERDDLAALSPVIVAALVALLLLRTPQSVQVATAALWFQQALTGLLPLEVQAALAAVVDDATRARMVRDPGNTGWVRDVSVSLSKVGDVARARGGPGGCGGGVPGGSGAVSGAGGAGPGQHRVGAGRVGLLHEGGLSAPSVRPGPPRILRGGSPEPEWAPRSGRTGAV